MLPISELCANLSVSSQEPKENDDLRIFEIREQAIQNLIQAYKTMFRLSKTFRMHPHYLKIKKEMHEKQLSIEEARRSYKGDFDREWTLDIYNSHMIIFNSFVSHACKFWNSPSMSHSLNQEEKVQIKIAELLKALQKSSSAKENSVPISLKFERIFNKKILQLSMIQVKFFESNLSYLKKAQEASQKTDKRVLKKETQETALTIVQKAKELSSQYQLGLD